MGNKIEIGSFASVLAKELSQYIQNVADGVKEATDKTVKELLENTRRDAPKRRGKYSKAMSTKTLYESNYDKRVVWYVKPPFHGLAHLLEKGHAKRGGGRVKAYPHIANNEEKAKKDFEAKVKEVIKNGSK